jgi:acyl carrier protein
MVIDEQDIKQRVEKVLKEVGGLGEDEYENVSSLNDLGFDSLAIIEAIIALSEEFSVEIDEDDFIESKVETIEQVEEYIKRIISG